MFRSGCQPHSPRDRRPLPDTWYQPLCSGGQPLPSGLFFLSPFTYFPGPIHKKKCPESFIFLVF